MSVNQDSQDELERGINTGILLRTKIRNTLYNRKIGFSMAEADNKTANEMLDELVEDLAYKSERLITAHTQKAVTEAIDKTHYTLLKKFNKAGVDDQNDVYFLTNSDSWHEVIKQLKGGM